MLTLTVGAAAVALHMAQATPQKPFWQDMLQRPVVQFEPREPYPGYCEVNTDDKDICNK